MVQNMQRINKDVHKRKKVMLSWEQKVCSQEWVGSSSYVLQEAEIMSREKEQ